MTRINVYTAIDERDPFPEPPTVEGWFDLESAEVWDEGTRWDGSNNISLATGSQWDHERLYRTAGKRWVLNAWSQWEGRKETWRFIDHDAAQAWLIENEYSAEAIKEILGVDLEAERGPGQPQIGTPIKATITTADLALIDEAIERGEYPTRSAAVRSLVSKALS